MKYVLAAVLLVAAVGIWGSAFGIYYATSWGGTPEQACSRASC